MVENIRWGLFGMDKTHIAECSEVSLQSSVYAQWKVFLEYVPFT